MTKNASQLKNFYAPTLFEIVGLAAAGLGLGFTGFANEIGSLIGLALPLVLYGVIVLIMANPSYAVAAGANPNPLVRAIKPAILTAIALTALFFVLAIVTLGLFAYFLYGPLAFIAANAFWIWLLGAAGFWIFRAGQEAQDK